MKLGTGTGTGNVSRRRALLAAAVATSVAVALTAAFSSYARAAHRSAKALPRLSVCGDATDLRPSYVLLGCCDGGQFLTRVRWSLWTQARAVGRAVWWQNLCTPDCATGNFRRDTVAVRLSRPRICRTPRTLLFTRMTLAVQHAPLVKVGVPYFAHPSCP